MPGHSFKKSCSAAILAATIFALSGCERGAVAPGLSRDVSGADTHTPDAAGTAQMRWDWRAGDLQGWTVNPASAAVSWPSGGGLGLASPAQAADPDLFIRSPKLSVAGEDFSRIRVDLEAIIPAPDLDLAMYYSTKDHGESFEYRGGPLDGAPLEAGERRVLIYDMFNQAAGAPDWMESVVTQLRFDLPQGSNSSYIVHSIRLCPAQLADCS